MSSKETNPKEKPTGTSESDCGCGENPFNVLPPEIRPQQRSWKSSFRRVTCPGCETVYWTDRETDLCNACR